MGDWTNIIHRSSIILSKILKENDSYILFHDDADGCCATAILLHLLSQKNQILPEYNTPENHSVELTPRLCNRLIHCKPKLILSVDLALTASKDKLRNLLEKLDASMLIYDHHIQSASTQWPSRCIHINPLNYNLGNVPASNYAHIIYNHYTNLKETCWVAAIGIVADYRTKDCINTIKEVKETYPYLYTQNNIDQQTALHSPIKQMVDLVNAGYQHSNTNGALLAIQTLLGALKLKDPQLLLKGRTKEAALLHQFRNEVHREIHKYIKQFTSKAEILFDNQLALYHIKPKFNIASQIATQLQQNVPTMIIAIIIPETQNKLKISLRRGRNNLTNLAELAETSTTTLQNASGGGHPEAAGCTIRKQDLEKWKKNLQKTLTTKKNKTNSRT